MHLGQLDICLSVKDLQASSQFYERLGFLQVDGVLESGYLILSKDQTRIGLYQHNEPNMLNFRGADLVKLAAHLKQRGLPNVPDPELEADGTLGFFLSDPDGNQIYFNT